MHLFFMRPRKFPKAKSRAALAPLKSTNGFLKFDYITIIYMYLNSPFTSIPPILKISKSKNLKSAPCSLTSKPPFLKILFQPILKSKNPPRKFFKLKLVK